MKLITIETAAEQLSSHPETVRRAIRAGKLKAYQLGNNYRVAQEELDSWIESLRVTPQAEQDLEEKHGNA